MGKKAWKMATLLKKSLCSRTSGTRYLHATNSGVCFPGEARTVWVGKGWGESSVTTVLAAEAPGPNGDHHPCTKPGTAVCVWSRTGGRGGKRIPGAGWPARLANRLKKWRIQSIPISDFSMHLHTCANMPIVVSLPFPWTHTIIAVDNQPRRVWER